VPTRYDAGTLGTVEATPSGGIKVPAYLTRVGVFTYRDNAGGVRRELRLPEEVFSEDSLATLRHATVTDLHPNRPVNPSTWKQVTIGHVAEDVRADGKHVAASLIVQDADAIQSIGDRSRRELSCGYNCSLEMSSGEHDGEKYDAIQRDIRYNHVAIGPEGWGRAGSSVALRLDSGDAIQVDSKEEDNPMIIRIDGKDYDVSTAEGKKAADAAIATLAAARDTATGRADGLATQVASLTKDLATATDPKAIAERVKVRADLLTTARAVADSKGFTFDDKGSEAKSDLEIMAATIKASDPTFNADGKSEDFLRGMFSALSVTKPAPATETKEDSTALFLARAKVDGKDKTKDVARVDANESRKKNEEANKSAWTKPLAFSKDSPAK
jgi:hypothetical protein